MKVFVTGGTGFIGSHVVAALLARKHEVTILARNPRKIPSLAHTSGVRIIDGSIFDFDRIEKVLVGMDACIHIALGWGDSAMDMFMNETRPSVFICEAAAKAGVKHFLYCSSIEAVGPRDRTLNEEMLPLPLHVYGATKAAAEGYVLAIGQSRGMRVNIIRPGCTMGGPAFADGGACGNQIIADLVKQAKTGKPIEVDPNDGVQITSGQDMARVFCAALESTVNRQIYFGMAGAKMYFTDLANKAIAATNSTSTIVFTKEKVDERPHLFETAKIKQDFGLTLDSWPDICNYIEWLAKQ